MGFKYRTAKNTMKKQKKKQTSRNTTNDQSIKGDRVVYTDHNPKIPPKVKTAHSFIRKADFGTILSSNTAPVFGAYAFKLSDFPSYTEFTALYDQFRIVKVDVQFLHLASAINNTNSASSIVLRCPRFYSVLDFDDSTAPTAIDDLRQYNNCITVNSDTSYMRSFAPASLELEYVSTILSGYSPVFGKWHDCTYSSLPHYGLKYALDTTPIAGPTSAFGYNVEVTLHLEFRQSR